MEHVAQTIPVRIYQAENQIMLAAPMPGLKPQDISVAVNGKTITIMDQERGPGQHDREPMVCEWTIGPYFREVVLDEPVDDF
jgi:HSP20 family protein